MAIPTITIQIFAPVSPHRMATSAIHGYLRESVSTIHSRTVDTISGTRIIILTIICIMIQLTIFFQFSPMSEQIFNSASSHLSPI